MTACTDYVKKYASEHGLKYMEAVKQAGPSYHAQKPANMATASTASELAKCHAEVAQLKQERDKSTYDDMPMLETPAMYKKALKTKIVSKNPKVKKLNPKKFRSITGMKMQTGRMKAWEKMNE
jgi:hypothetical protein